MSDTQRLQKAEQLLAEKRNVIDEKLSAMPEYMINVWVEMLMERGVSWLAHAPGEMQTMFAKLLIHTLQSNLVDRLAKKVTQ